MKKLLIIPMFFACFMSMGQAKTVGGKHFIGEKFGGGIVFHVTKDGLHGLIAATSDQSKGIIWGGTEVGDKDSTGTSIGTGLSNTNYIIKEQDSANADVIDPPSYAAGLARSYEGGGYSDWYLPSKDELAKLYALKLLRFGGLANFSYWSSSITIDGLGVWGQRFDNGELTEYAKHNTFYVRAIRSF